MSSVLACFAIVSRRFIRCDVLELRCLKRLGYSILIFDSDESGISVPKSSGKNIEYL